MQVDEIFTFYDIIYISAVLEHLLDYKDKSRKLLRHCKRLFIMVPFKEMRNGKRLEPDPHQHHQNTFDRHSFDFLIDEKLALSIRTKILYCPIAWSWPLSRWMMEYLIKNPLRILLEKPIACNPRMILYDICSITKG